MSSDDAEEIGHTMIENEELCLCGMAGELCVYSVN